MLGNVDRKWYDGYKRSQVHTSYFSFERTRALTGNSIAFDIKVNVCEIRQLVQRSHILFSKHAKHIPSLEINIKFWKQSLFNIKVGGGR